MLKDYKTIKQRKVTLATKGLTYVMCEHAYGIYAAKPFVVELRAKELQFVVLTPGSLEGPAKKHLHLREVEWSTLDTYQSPFARLMTKWYELIFVPLDFSESYRLRKAIKMTSTEMLVAKATRILKLPQRKVNRGYVRLCSVLARVNVIPTLPGEPVSIIAFTKVQRSYLLAPLSKIVTLVMESWDHPMKEPYLIAPRRHLAWNSALARDAVTYQCLEGVDILERSLKFKYVEEYRPQSYQELRGELPERLKDDLPPRRQYVVYPMCTSSKYHGFRGEVMFLRELAADVRAAGLQLYVRPYPLAPDEDIRELSQIEGVAVGALSNLQDGLDVLSEEERRHKYLLIHGASLIINVGTTFALDAAMIGTPVLQLKLTPGQYDTFGTYAGGVHIRKYLWTEHTFEYPLKGDKLQDVNKSGQPARFSTNLKKWIQN